MLTNLGDTPLRIASLSLTGTDAGDFAIQSNSTCGAGSSVAGAGRCTINLAFKPTATGARSATLVISDSDPSSPQTVSLSGTGTKLTLPGAPLKGAYPVIAHLTGSRPEVGKKEALVNEVCQRGLTP
jgi:hypothetical protein